MTANNEMRKGLDRELHTSRLRCELLQREIHRLKAIRKGKIEAGLMWQYESVADTATCEPCKALGKQTFSEEELPGKFPDMIYMTDKQILAQTHPNCRCVLNRMEVTEQ